MTAYADSSFLVSLYREDIFHREASRHAKALTHPLPFTPLHRLEVFNALRLAVWRGDIEAESRKVALAMIGGDLESGILVHHSLRWTEVLRRAEELSAAHTETLGNRSADILHVAAALEGGASLFLSFDAAQRKLAKAAGLAVKP